MPERPLLILPSPGEPAKRRTKPGGSGQFHRPSREQQAKRLTPRFKFLQQALEARRTRLQVEASGLIPEEVVVLETVGTVDGFIRAVENVPGMEWLAEFEEEDIPPDDDFFAMSKDGEALPNRVLRGRLFMVFANQQALLQMLSLWNDWQSKGKLPHGLGRWKKLFEQLRDVRPWGVRDRLLETGVLQDWQERVNHGQEVVPCEIELWYRKNPQQRRTARDRVAELVEGQEGQVITEAAIEEIAYHALLAHLPVGGIRRLLGPPDEDMALVQCEQIQFIQAGGQMSSFLADDAQEKDQEALPEEKPIGEPVVALFDGLPLQAHRRLQGRLVVDDPDGFEQDYPASNRRHGTAMASLIVHGDMGTSEEPISRPLYVRPILRPDPRGWWKHAEVVPEDTLVVDLLHRAVRRLFDGEGNESPVAQEVAVINLSIGILDRPFEQTLSPLARLLDWLAWRYQILFVVSAGNYPGRIELSANCRDLSSLAPKDLQRHVILSVAADARHRRLLSPAEAVNTLTVASVHDDSSMGSVPGWRDPYVDAGLPSPINAQGMGYRRGIKPEVLAAGGRVVVREYLPTRTRATLEIYDRTLAPGHLIAAPGPAPGDQGAVRYSRGTSNATALVSRAAGLLYDVVEKLRDEPGGEIIDTVPRSVWLKALIAHGADWGTAGSVLNAILSNAGNRQQFREYVTRLLGYGAVDINRVRECTVLRASALSGGTLKKEESHMHRFPLPPSLSGRLGHRRLTISLAWFSPVNPRHHGWRSADLWFSPPQNKPLRVQRQQADWQAVQRGTLQHEILEGGEASVFVAGTNLEIQVSCRADAGALEEEVPYALVTTLEVAKEIGVEIYDEVRAAVHAAQVRVATSA